MSKIGKKPIAIPEGVEVKINDHNLEIKGKLGTLNLPILEYTNAEIKDKELLVSVSGGSKQARANWGTMRALAQNAVEGVSAGFVKYLELEGIGFRASLEGKTLVLNIGFTHPVKFTPPEGVTLTIEKSAIKISGADKSAVGEVAAKIRALKKPEPYKGTGIKYRGEVIARKEGKKAASAGAAGA
jgi:large subunit ribosomal protein L6